MLPLGLSFTLYNVAVVLAIALVALESAAGGEALYPGRALQSAMVLALAYAPSLPLCPRPLQLAVRRSRMRNSVQALALRTGLLCGAAGGALQDLGALWQARQPFLFLYVVASCVEWAMYLLALSMRLTILRVDTANCVFLVFAPPMVCMAYILPFRLQGYRTIFVGFDLLACYTVMRSFEVSGLGVVQACRRPSDRVTEVRAAGCGGGAGGKRGQGRERGQGRRPGSGRGLGPGWGPDRATVERYQRETDDPHSPSPPASPTSLTSSDPDLDDFGAEPPSLLRRGVIRAFRARHGLIAALGGADGKGGEAEPWGQPGAPKEGAPPGRQCDHPLCAPNPWSLLLPRKEARGGREGLCEGQAPAEPAPPSPALQPVDYLMTIGLSLKLAADQLFIFYSFYTEELQRLYALRAMRCVCEGLGTLILAYASLAAML